MNTVDGRQTTALIELVAVHRRYRSGSTIIHAVRDVSLALDAGTVTALIGPSGSGKTTVANLLIGAERPDEGSIVRNTGLGEAWSDVAIVPQGLGLMTELTIGENIGLPARLSGTTGRAVEEVTRALELDELERRFPSDASLGEQQRAAVARAVAAEPKLLVADEPTAHQDERRAGLVMDALCQLAEGGTAVLVATHERRVLDRVDSIVTMIDGELALDDVRGTT